MARKKSDPGEEPVKKAGRAGARKSSAAKSESRPKLVRIHGRRAAGRLMPGEGHREAQAELRKLLGGYEAMLATPRPSNRMQGQNNLMGLAVGLKHTGGSPTGDLAIRVFVRKKVPRSRVTRDALARPEINGFPTDVVEIGIPRPMSSGTSGAGPVPCGVFIHNDGIRLQNGSFEAGTLGCLVKIGTALCLMTCNHVIANLNQARDQDPINDGGTTIAKLFMAPPLLDPPSSNTVDVAVAEIIPGAVSNSLLGLPLVLPATDDVMPKDIVRKSGAETQVTSGSVSDVHFESPFQYSLPGIDLGSNIVIEKKYIFHDQILIQSEGESFCQEGDSGSIVLNDDDQAIGLLFAGDGKGFCFANPIKYIVKALGVTEILALGQA